MRLAKMPCGRRHKRHISPGPELAALVASASDPSQTATAECRISVIGSERGWFALLLDDAGEIDWTEVEELLESAYCRVAPGHLLLD
jgi:hypothetical protein